MIDFLKDFIDVLLNIDVALINWVHEYKTWTYILLFIIIFMETGFVVTPFLPGDSLLFAAGAIAANPQEPLGLLPLILILVSAAFLGDTANYFIGKFFGKAVYEKNYRLIKRKYLDQTHAFYEKHGGKTIIIARFVPIIRTFAPFVAGVGTMQYSRFLSFNIIGGILWVVSFSLAGYFFGNLPVVKQNFSIVIIAIIIISVLPIVYGILKNYLAKKR
jgi:membrane-associated protein